MYAAVHPSFTYAVARGVPGHDKLILAKDLVPARVPTFSRDGTVFGPRRLHRC